MFILAVNDHQTDVLPNLRSGQTDTIIFVHGLSHIVHELLELFIYAFHRYGNLLQDGIARLQNF